MLDLVGGVGSGRIGDRVGVYVVLVDSPGTNGSSGTSVCIHSIGVHGEACVGT
jgi:hypothetical protein